MWRGWVVVVALGLGLAACGLEQHDSTFGDEPPEFSAERLGTETSIADDLLTPAERESLARERGKQLAPGDEFDDETSADGSASGKAEEKDSDTYGKMALSFLTVAVTLGAAAAPYLLF
jgi:hypothetical protein